MFLLRLMSFSAPRRYSALVIAGELLPFGDEGFSVVVVARLEKNAGDDYGEECADEEGD